MNSQSFTKKILLVDDELDIQDIIESSLMENFYSVSLDKASDGLDAFLKCQNNKYDLIITDHRMPIMSGIALVVALKSYENQNLETNIVMISGFLNEEVKEKLRPRKIEFLEKPFKEVELIDIVTPYLI